MTQMVKSMAQALVISYLLGEVSALPVMTTTVDHGNVGAVKDANGAGTVDYSCGKYMRNVKGAANNYYTTDFYSSYTAKASIATAKAASNICIKTAFADTYCTGIKNSGNNAWKAGFTYIVGMDDTAVTPVIAPGLAISGVAACAQSNDVCGAAGKIVTIKDATAGKTAVEVTMGIVDDLQDCSTLIVATCDSPYVHLSGGASFVDA